MEKVVVDIGCGEDKVGDIGIDKVRTKSVDIICDINISLPFKNDVADEIIAYHVLEHVDDLVKVMEEICRVLKPC